MKKTIYLAATISIFGVANTTLAEHEPWHLTSIEEGDAAQVTAETEMHHHQRMHESEAAHQTDEVSGENERAVAAEAEIIELSNGVKMAPVPQDRYSRLGSKSLPDGTTILTHDDAHSKSPQKEGAQ